MDVLTWAGGWPVQVLLLTTASDALSQHQQRYMYLQHAHGMDMRWMEPCCGVTYQARCPALSRSRWGLVCARRPAQRKLAGQHLLRAASIRP